MQDAGDPWAGLLAQSRDLVSQDYHNFPKVDRSIPQLQQYAESLRARTNKFRTLNNQIAATRLLAQQGFDASRLTQEVTSLEIQPTIEDVFHADTTSVEEYLKQVEESTILAALQEAQQDTVATFESYMDECMARDWAANKRQLFGLIAPHSGGGIMSSLLGGGMLAPGPLIGAQGQAGMTAQAGPVLRLPAAEQAYVNVIRRANKAAAANDQSFDLVKEFRNACKVGEAKGGSGHETTMGSCWSLLCDMLGECRARGVTAGPGPNTKYVAAAAAGAKHHLERGHSQHMRSTLLRHKVAAERGADPEQLREVQAYIQVKFGSTRGTLDFQSPGGLDTSWVQIYYCLRNGWVDSARRAAERAHDAIVSARLGEGGFKAALDEWARHGGRVSERTSRQLAVMCEMALRDKASLKSQVSRPYMVLVCALLAGDSRAADALTATLAQQQLPSVLATIEDYMWCKLTLLLASQPGGPAAGASVGIASPFGYKRSSSANPGAGPSTSAVSHSLLMGSGVPPYGLADLQADINRWPAAYYSKQGKEPLLYVTVLLLSLQFQAALRFLWKEEAARAYRVDAVHLGIALHQEGALSLTQPAGAEPGPDVASMIHSYGRKFLHHDSSVALQYYMLAAVVRGNSIAVKGQMLRELLTESRDFGTLLGGGSGPGGPPGGALRAYVPDPLERKQLFEAVAYECQVAAQPEEAVELYLAADRPRQALAILNQQLSAVLPHAAEEVATGLDATGAAVALKRFTMRGQDARARIGPNADTGSQREVEAFDQLGAIWELMLASRKGRHDLALQKLHEMGFVPLEKARVEHCIRATQASLHPAVQERLQDVLAIAADTIAAQKAGASREKLFTLRNELDALCLFANSVSFRVPQMVYQKLCETAASFS